MAKEQETNVKLERMFDAAHRDPDLKRRLLTDPRSVAKEWEVELADDEVERLTKLGAFFELTHEVKHGALRRCDPRVCYPSSTWLHAEATSLAHEIAGLEFRHRWPRYGIYYPPRYQVYYPPRYMRPIEWNPVFYPRGDPYFRRPMGRMTEFGLRGGMLRRR